METLPTAPVFKPSRPPAAPAPPARRITRIRTFDYFCILAGVALSLWLSEAIGARVQAPGANLSPAQAAVTRSVPSLLLLPTGIIALWPLYYVSQFLLGRRHPITSGEWLLGLAWLGTMTLIAWAAWRVSGSMPEALKSDGAKHMALFSYSAIMLALGAIAAVIWIVGIIGRWKYPWTHMLSVALMIWPYVPLAIIWTWGLKLE